MIHPSVKIGEHCIIDPSAKIKSGCVIKDYVFIGPNVVIESDVVISRYCEIRENVTIGSGTIFGSRCTLSANSKIGERCLIKYGFVLCDTPDLKSKTKHVGIVGNDVLIGANVTLMPGVCLSDKTIIGACSQVRKSTQSNEVWYGNPAKKV